MIKKLLSLFLIFSLFFISCTESLPEETRNEFCNAVDYSVTDVSVNNIDNKISIVLDVKNEGNQVISGMEYRIKSQKETGTEYTGFYTAEFDNKLSPEQKKSLFINYPEVNFKEAKELILYPIVEVKEEKTRRGVCREKEKKINLEDYKGGVRIRIE
ncbi:MAG: hypothetical protein QXR30_03350 [Candidatus Woesearchaeota archaeon]